MRRSSIVNRLARAPRILTAVALAWLATIAFLASDTGVGIAGFFLAVFGGAALAVAWAGRGAMFRFARRHADSPPRVSRTWWVMVPACLILASVCLMVEPRDGPLFQLRFRLSEAALTQEAARLVDTEIGAPIESRWIGLFQVVRITAQKRQVRFITAACGVVDSCGLVYAPDLGPGHDPDSLMEDRFTHLRGPWWHVYEGF